MQGSIDVHTVPVACPDAPRRGVVQSATQSQTWWPSLGCVWPIIDLSACGAQFDMPTSAAWCAQQLPRHQPLLAIWHGSVRITHPTVSLHATVILVHSSCNFTLFSHYALPTMGDTDVQLRSPRQVAKLLLSPMGQVAAAGARSLGLVDNIGDATELSAEAKRICTASPHNRHAAALRDGLLVGAALRPEAREVVDGCKLGIDKTMGALIAVATGGRGLVSIIERALSALRTLMLEVRVLIVCTHCCDTWQRIGESTYNSERTRRAIKALRALHVPIICYSTPENLPPMSIVVWLAASYRITSLGTHTPWSTTRAPSSRRQLSLPHCHGGC